MLVVLILTPKIQVVIKEEGKHVSYYNSCSPSNEDLSLLKYQWIKAKSSILKNFRSPNSHMNLMLKDIELGNIFSNWNNKLGSWSLTSVEKRNSWNYSSEFSI